MMTVFQKFIKLRINKALEKYYLLKLSNKVIVSKQTSKKCGAENQKQSLNLKKKKKKKSRLNSVSGEFNQKFKAWYK